MTLFSKNRDIKKCLNSCTDNNMTISKCFLRKQWFSLKTDSSLFIGKFGLTTFSVPIHKPDLWAAENTIQRITFFSFFLPAWIALHLTCYCRTLPIQHQIKRYDVINIDKWGYNFLVE